MVRACLIICLVTILLGPLYTEPGYSFISHSISELAAQNTGNAWIMRVGLLSLGFATILGFIQQRNLLNFPFLIFGIFIALSAIFPHKPFMPDRDYSNAIDIVHSWFASLAGFSSVIGFTLRAVVATRVRKKIVYSVFVAAYTLLPAGMFIIPSIQGLLQRLIFISFILWAYIEYPKCRGEK